MFRLHRKLLFGRVSVGPQTIQQSSLRKADGLNENRISLRDGDLWSTSENSDRDSRDLGGCRNLAVSIRVNPFHGLLLVQLKTFSNSVD
jgi:hypothetical protein